MCSLAIKPSPLRPNQKNDPIGDTVVFGNDRKAAKEINRLTRISRLDKALPRNRAQNLKSLESIWQEALRTLEEISQVATMENLKISQVAVITSAEKRLNKFGDKISSIYLPELKPGVDLFDKIRSFSKDPKRVLIPPFYMARNATQGPTFLVTYATSDKVREYVLKRSDREERASGMLDHQISLSFNGVNTRHGFAVPFTSWVDLGSGTHENYKGEIRETPLAKQIGDDFTLLAKTADPEFDKEVDHIMFAEMIPGKNLLDFIIYDYKNLTEDQRKKFFERLGRLAGKDLWTGTFDRMTPVMEDQSGKYVLDSRTYYCNLGNVMVTSTKDDVPFYFYAIDNGVHKDLIVNKELRKKYNEFLESHFSEEKPFDLLASTIVDCLKGSLANLLDDIDLDDIKSESDIDHRDCSEKRKLIAKEFKEDLKNSKIALDSLKLGLEGMTVRMQEEVLPNYEKTEQAEKFRAHMKEIYPEFLDSVEERFKILKTLRL